MSIILKIAATFVFCGFLSVCLYGLAPERSPLERWAGRAAVGLIAAAFIIAAFQALVLAWST